MIPPWYPVNSNDWEGTGKPVEMTMRTTCALQDCTPVTDSSWMLSERSKLFVQTGIWIGNPRSDRCQFQDFTTELLLRFPKLLLCKEETSKSVEMTMRTMCALQVYTPVTDFSWRLSERSKLFVHIGIQTSNPISDRNQFQDFTTELWVEAT